MSPLEGPNNKPNRYKFDTPTEEESGSVARQEAAFKARLAAALLENPFPSAATVQAQLDEQDARYGRVSVEPHESEAVAKAKLKQLIEDLLVAEHDTAIDDEKIKLAQAKVDSHSESTGKKIGADPRGKEPRRKHRRGTETIRKPEETKDDDADDRDHLQAFQNEGWR